MPRRCASPLCKEKRTRIEPHISIAVPQASPSPCAKCASPTENKAPSTNTGSISRAPLLNCLMSRLPPFSRGGIVRKRLGADRPARHRALRFRRQCHAAAGGELGFAALHLLAQFA